MYSHFKNVEFYIPDLKQRKILDLGSGYGGFLIEAAEAGADAVGIEIFDEFIKISHEKAAQKHLTLTIVKSSGEKLPFPDGSFDFVNMCEVIEHVEEPETVLREVFRVLRPGGKVYLSAPNRFAIWDPHFHLYFVNFLPRSLSHLFISIFGKHKQYTYEMGRQRLDEMHYYTLRTITKLGKKCGFEAVDMRPIKIRKKYGTGLKAFLIYLAYRLARPWYFDSYHILLSRS